MGWEGGGGAVAVAATAMATAVMGWEIQVGCYFYLFINLPLSFFFS